MFTDDDDDDDEEYYTHQSIHTQSHRKDHRSVILLLLLAVLPIWFFSLLLLSSFPVQLKWYEFCSSPPTLSFAVKNGYSAAPIALSDGLDIRVNTAVKNIKYFPGGVEVTAENLKTNNSTVTYKGEFWIYFSVYSISLAIIDSWQIRTAQCSLDEGGWQCYK